MQHQPIVTDRIATRSNRAEIRNPILALPAVARLRELDPEARLALQELLLDLQHDARLRAEASWSRRKPPVAAYWAACGVYAGHIARAIGPGSGRRCAKSRAGKRWNPGEGKREGGPGSRAEHPLEFPGGPHEL